MEVMQIYCLPFPYAVVSVVLRNVQLQLKLCLTHEKVTHRNHREFPNLERALSHWQYVLKGLLGCVAVLSKIRFICT